MTQRHKIIQEINGEIDSAVEKFVKSVPKIEKDLSRDITTIIKGLDTSKDGTIKTTVTNLRKMGQIERKMTSAFESGEYVGNVDNFLDSFDTIQGLETKYFNSVLTNFAQPSVMDEITKQSIKTTTDALTGSNITANVIDPVNNLVRQGIEGGQQWDALRGSIDTFLRGADGGTGALSRYTTTITNDSLNTYARTYENIIADNENIEWFEYVGREITDTREFCRVLDGARWFKRSDISDLIAGKIHNHKSGKTTTVPLYKKTQKPYGMKQETTTNNFIQLAGGWNCGHHAYPVPDHLVPDNIKNATDETGVEDEFTPATSNIDELNVNQIDSKKQLNNITKTEMPNEFWNMMEKKPPSVRLAKLNEGSYNDIKGNIVLDLKRHNTPDLQKRIIAHEYGHTIHVQRKWVTQTERHPIFDEAFSKSKNRLTKGKKGRKRWEQLNDINQKLTFDVKDELKLKYNHNQSQADEYWGGMQDVLGSLTEKEIGYGHTKSYYKGYGGYAEYFAHAMENKYGSNPYLKELFPDIFDDMVKMVDDLNKTL